MWRDLCLNIQYILNRLGQVDIWGIAIVIWTFGYNTFGQDFWGVVALAVSLVMYDTFLKCVYISKKYIHENLTIETPIEFISLRKAIYYWFKAETWNKNYLSSAGMSRIIEKLLVYNASIAIAFYAGQVVPDIKLFGTFFALNDCLPGTVTISILIVELSSINENLIELGYSSIANAVKRVLDYLIAKLLPLPNK